jgi:sugar phosphate isomerase/epimerase
MIFGAITNSWRNLLDDHDLTALVGEAQAKGARHIELRQTCLGNCETGEGEDWRPVLSGLEALVNQYSDLSYDLAMALPCLSSSPDPQGEQFQAALQAAKLVGRDTPHLRVVDPNAGGDVWQRSDDFADAAASVTDLVREAARQGVIFSMENSGQPISSMALLVEEVRSKLSPEEGNYLGLCPDPTNQLRRFPDTDPLADLEALPLDMVKIVHFKQARDGRSHPTVDTGDMDCAGVLRVLEEKGYQGAAIMEIPPDQQVLDNLAASFAYLEASAK